MFVHSICWAFFKNPWSQIFGVLGYLHIYRELHLDGIVNMYWFAYTLYLEPEGSAYRVFRASAFWWTCHMRSGMKLPLIMSDQCSESFGFWSVLHFWISAKFRKLKTIIYTEDTYIKRMHCILFELYHEPQLFKNKIWAWPGGATWVWGQPGLYIYRQIDSKQKVTLPGQDKYILKFCIV